MRRRDDIIVHIKRVDNEPRKKRLKYSDTLARKITSRDDEISRKRQEFEIDRLQVTLGISTQAAEYLLQQHGRMVLVTAGGDYKEFQFVAWLECAHAPIFYELSRSFKKEYWESRILKLAAYLVPKKAREERLGDLQEACDQLMANGCGKLRRRLVTAWGVVLIAIAQIRITFIDCLGPGYQQFKKADGFNTSDAVQNVQIVSKIRRFQGFINQLRARKSKAPN